MSSQVGKIVGMDKASVPTQKARKGQSLSYNGMSSVISRAVALPVPSVVSGPASSVSPKNLLEMQILGPYPIPTESESGVQQTIF